MVKAARKAHGESTEVGSEQDLWGADVENGKEDTASDVLVSLQMESAERTGKGRDLVGEGVLKDEGM